MLQAWAGIRPTIQNLRDLITVWEEDANYSHGFLVVPIALCILKQQLATQELKKSNVVVPATCWGWFFLAVVLSGAHRLPPECTLAGDRNHPPRDCGATWSFGSWPLLRRIWPAIAYLVFMLPLPRLVNNWLALPLQSIAASSSCFLLQLSGIWAIQEGNVINLSTNHGMKSSTWCSPATACGC